MGDETASLEVSYAPRTEARGLLLAPGDRVGRYQVRRVLGEGGMGRVYLARDLTLGRSVALKLVRHRDGEPRRVLVEAQMTARFSHPHIVQLYDVGEHAGGPYLALEYLEGESLRERVLRDRLSVDEVLRIARAIADALAHAHAAAVLHGDLKPSNVMLPRDGRLRVVDFGLAATIGTAGSRSGTPTWMAPEQWAGEPLSDRTDVWALAVLVHGLLAGEHPFGAHADAPALRAAIVDPARAPRPLAGAVPAAVAELVLRSLARAPQGRPTAREWMRVLDDALAGGAGGALDAPPYRGLAAFDETDAHLFFGREADVDAFLERLRDHPLLPVVGPSGTGKTSFIHAGVVPRLRAREPWTVISARPGQHPFAAVAARLLDGVGVHDPREIAAVADELRATPTLLALRLATIASGDGGKTVLVIDQLEELFTHGAADAEIDAFLDMIVHAADDPRDPVRVIVTLRDDFLGRVPNLRDVFVLRQLGARELRRAITAPLERTGHRFEDPAIVDDMLAELGGVAALPLLQFACRALWDGRDVAARTLTRAAYREIGGVAGALVRHADAFIAGLAPHEQAAARAILLRLVSGSTTRRVVARATLLAELPADAEGVLDRVLAARLVVQRRVEGEDTVLVELAHEALLTAWTHLRRWLDETGDQRRLLEELEAASAVWERRGRRSDETWGADDIANARRRAQQTDLVIPAHVGAFLAAGELRHRRRRRRARARLGIGLVLAAGVTVGSLALAHRFREQRIAAELASGNLGTSELVLRPFDGVGAPTVDVRELPALAWQLHGVDRDNVHRPGDPLPRSLVRAHTRRAAATLVVALEAPGGAAFLRIDGRGRRGETCAPAWVRLQALPGFAARTTTPPRVEIAVPTCRASAVNTVTVPAGDVIYGGPGEPPTRHAGYVEPEQRVFVGAFAIDRTEVTNAAFAAFAALTKITGYPAPVYPTARALARSADPEAPVTAVDAFTAEAFCRFMGKRLPSEYEWVKAARGGVELDGRPNPAPRRLYPWGATLDRRCANGDGADDGHPWTAPAGALACGASPYGVLDLAGNVAEWIAREGQVAANPLRVVRGGAHDSPWELEQTTTVFRNGREDRQFDLAIGVRCVSGPELE